jgi:hypothetical protein
MPLIETIGSSSSRGLGMFGKIGLLQAQPNTISNLMAWYTADSWTGSSWTDLSGNGRTASSYYGSISKNTSYSNENGATKSFTTINSPSANGGIRLPDSLDLNGSYTFFNVTRRINTETTGGDSIQRGRIWDGLGDNWLSGFHDGSSGVAYHMNWITPSSGTSNDPYVNNWTINTDQLNLFRTNGVRSGPSATAGTVSTNTTLTLHYGNYSNGPGGSGSERGKWAVAEAIFYNRELSDTEYKSVEGYLSNKYGITIQQ